MNVGPVSSYDRWGQKLGMPPPIYTSWAMSLVFTGQCFSEKKIINGFSCICFVYGTLIY